MASKDPKKNRPQNDQGNPPAHQVPPAESVDDDFEELMDFGGALPYSPGASGIIPLPERQHESSDSSFDWSQEIQKPGHFGPSDIEEGSGEVMVPLGHLPPPTKGYSSSKVPLGSPPSAESPSGQSLSTWSEVIRRQRAAVEAAAGTQTPLEPVKVDAPSDRDLLGKIQSENGEISGITKPSEPAGIDTSEISTSNLQIFTPPLATPASTPDFTLPPLSDPHEGSSVLEFRGAKVDGSSEMEIHLPPEPGASAVLDLEHILPPMISGPRTGGSAIQFHVTASPSDAGGAMPAPAPFSQILVTPPTALPSDSKGDDESIPFAMDVGGPASSVKLVDVLPGGSLDVTRSSILDVLLSDMDMTKPRSNDVLDLDAEERSKGTKQPTMSTMGPDKHGKSAPTQPAFDINAGAPSIPGSIPGSGDTIKPPSWVDAIPSTADRIPGGSREEDSVDLYTDGIAPPPSITDSGSLEISSELIDEMRRRTQQIESSSIDLGSNPSMNESIFDMHVHSGSMPFPPSQPEIDLDLPDNPRTDSSMIRREAIEPEEQQAQLMADIEARRRARESAGDVHIPMPSPLVAVDGDAEGRRKFPGWLGTAAGFLVGAGGVFAAYSSGALDNKSEPEKTEGVVSVDRANFSRIQKQAEDASKSIAAAQAKEKQLTETVTQALTAAGAKNPADIPGSIKTLAASGASPQMIKDLTDRATLAETSAKTVAAQLDDANKMLTAAKAEAVKSNDTLKGITQAFAEAGLNKDKPDEALKGLATNLTKAQEEAKAASTKLTDAMKMQTVLIAKADSAAKELVEAKKQLGDATQAKASTDATLKSLTDKLTKAKFVAPNADTTAILRGIDDAIKAAGSDATSALRDELVKSREETNKIKNDLTSAQAKEAEATKLASALKSDVQKLRDDIKGMDVASLKDSIEKLTKQSTTLTAQSELAEKAAAQAKLEANKIAADLKASQDKFSVDTDKMKAEKELLAKEISALTSKAEEANKAATLARTEAEKSTTSLKVLETQYVAETNRLKSENERLTRNLEAVSDLASAIKMPVSAGSVESKPNPGIIADRIFGDGLRAYYSGRYDDASNLFTKAIQIYSDDARYHYLLGLSLWSKGKSDEADVEFKKGRELEIQGRPSYRSINTVMERIQGTPRQAINAHRP
jgi:hypothetical protein